VLPSRQTFLIVCEGPRPSPNYFDGFKLGSAQVKVIGLGSNTASLVEQAIRLKRDYPNAISTGAF